MEFLQILAADNRKLGLKPEEIEIKVAFYALPFGSHQVALVWDQNFLCSTPSLVLTVLIPFLCKPFNICLTGVHCQITEN